ncbi:hypothetical protein J5TS2_04720 [Brevibacillus halotolerans]|nr:hypothetical protein J5TS2_04720 [Brevibacillus halotolerans]
MKKVILFFSLLSFLFCASLSFVEKQDIKYETAISAYLDDPGH